MQCPCRSSRPIVNNPDRRHKGSDRGLFRAVPRARDRTHRRVRRTVGPYHAFIGRSQHGSSPRRFTVRGPAGIAVLAAVTAYAWWATGLAPFTAAAAAAVALPVGGLVVIACLPRAVASSAIGAGRTPRPWYGALPWAGLLVVAVGLEIAGLALGGRSSAVPTLSTVVDHALAWHGVRFILFLVWLGVGWAPVVRRAGWRSRPGT